jgi:hypothetical protein
MSALNPDPDQALGFAIVGNVAQHERSGRIAGVRFRGTPTFGPRARIFMGEVYTGMNEQVHAIGKNRVSRRWCNSVLDLTLVDDLRVSAVYAHSEFSALSRLKARLFDTKEAAQHACEGLISTVDWLRQEKALKAASTNGAKS